MIVWAVMKKNAINLWVGSIKNVKPGHLVFACIQKLLKWAHFNAFCFLFLGQPFRSPKVRWRQRSWPSTSRKSSTLAHCLCSLALWKTTHKSWSTAATTRSCWPVWKHLIGGSVYFVHATVHESNCGSGLLSFVPGQSETVMFWKMLKHKISQLVYCKIEIKTGTHWG